MSATPTSSWACTTAGASLASWRLTTRREQTADEYGVFIQTLLRTRGIEPAQVTGVAISQRGARRPADAGGMGERYFGLSPFVVEPGVNVALAMRVDYPREVGADRVVQRRGGPWRSTAPPLIVVDFGTATTFDCVNARGEFIGGAIAPGIVDGRRGAHRPGGPAVPRRARAARRTPSAATRSPTSSRAWSTATPVWSTAWSSGCAREMDGAREGRGDGRPRRRSCAGVARAIERRQSAPDAGGLADRVRAGPRGPAGRRVAGVAGLTRA